jgi:hypothetical protein
VELLGGKICAESEANKGSTFYFCLPLVLTASKDSPAEISPRAPNQGVFDTQSCKSTGFMPLHLEHGLVNKNL